MSSSASVLQNAYSPNSCKPDTIEKVQPPDRKPASGCVIAAEPVEQHFKQGIVLSFDDLLLTRLARRC